MDQYSQAAEEWKIKLLMMRKSYIQFECDQLCDECKQPLISGCKEFYVFPCQHGFHKDCIFSVLKEIDRHYEKKIMEYQETQKQINALLSKQQKTQKSRNLSITDKITKVFNL